MSQLDAASPAKSPVLPELMLHSPFLFPPPFFGQRSSSPLPPLVGILVGLHLCTPAGLENILPGMEEVLDMG